MGLPDVTGQGVTRKINGKELTFSIIDIDDYSVIHKTITDTREDSYVKASAKAQLDPQVISEGLIAIASKIVTQKETGEYFETMSGIQHLAFLSLRKEHPEVKLEEIGKWIPDIVELSEVLAKVIGGDGQENPTKSPEKTTAL